MNRRNLLAFAAAALIAVPAFSQASSWTLDKNHSQANFQIKHLGVSTVRGSISGITGTIVWDDKNPAASSVTATLDANTVSTNNDARDKHLKSPDFFNVAANPTITFKSTAVSVAGPGKLKVVGDLTLAGVTKPVTLMVDGPTVGKGMGGKPVAGFSATGTIKRSDFNFGSKFSAPVLGDDVTFTLDLEAGKS